MLDIIKPVNGLFRNVADYRNYWCIRQLVKCGEDVAHKVQCMVK